MSRFGASLLVAVIIVGTLSMGSVDPRVLAVAVVLLGLATVLLWWNEPVVPRSSATIVVSVGMALTVFTLLQCIPLSLGQLTSLSPHAADVWSHALSPFHESAPHTATLSLDPNATRVEVVRGTAYVLAFVAALAAPSRLLQRTLIVTSALVLVVAGAHYAFDIKSVYGIYRPRTDVTAIAPFLNGNHLSAFGNVGLVLAYASMLSSRPLAPKPLLAVVVVLAGASDMFWASRGAVASAITGMLIVTVFAFRDRARAFVGVAIPMLVALAGGAMMLLAASPYVLKELADADVSKFKITATVFRSMVPAYPWFGAGRGAFESTFAEFRTGEGFVVWTHPENLAAEWVSGWGIPVAAAAIAALAWALRPRTVRRHTVGAWTTIVIVALHNFVDFSLEIPAMAIAVAVCAGIVCAGPAPDREKPRWVSRHRVVATVAAIAAACAACVVLFRSPDLLDDRMKIQHALKAKRSFEEVSVYAHDAMLRHPAEPYFPYAVAVAASYSGKNVVPWIDRTLERAPVYPPAHLVLARWLRRRSHSQARLEYRLYAEQFGGQPVDVGEVEGLVDEFLDAIELAPAGRQGVELLEQLAPRLRSRLPASSFRIDEEIVTRAPASKGPLLRRADAAVGDLHEAWCDDACARDSLATADRARRAAPDECAGYVAVARVLAARNDFNSAFATLKTAIARDRPVCDRAWAELAIAAKRPNDATAAIDALANEPCTDAACVTQLLEAVALENQRGSKNRALIHLKRAASLTDDDALLESVAQSAAQLGLHTQAAQVYQRLLARHPDDRRLSSLTAAETNAATQP